MKEPSAPRRRFSKRPAVGITGGPEKARLAFVSVPTAAAEKTSPVFSPAGWPRVFPSALKPTWNPETDQGLVDESEAWNSPASAELPSIEICGDVEEIMVARMARDPVRGDNLPGFGTGEWGASRGRLEQGSRLSVSPRTVPRRPRYPAA